LWVENGLIHKLIAARVVEKRDEDIGFTLQFRKFMNRHLQRKRTRPQTLEESHAALVDYNPVLENLSADEIGATMVLLEFYFDNTNAAVPDGR
jgi:hypothetical protein